MPVKPGLYEKVIDNHLQELITVVGNSGTLLTGLTCSLSNYSCLRPEQERKMEKLPTFL